MGAKISEARRAMFFAALRETGNQTLAAAQARVSLGWVSQHQSRDPTFRAAIEEAVAAAHATLSTPDAVGPTDALRSQVFEELAVRRTNGCRVQIARARCNQWTPSIEARFLAALASCCNVKESCATVGLTVQAAYGHRKRWRRFAERWDEALAIGFDRIEFAMIGAAGAMLGETDYDPETDLKMTSIDDAIRLLGKHQFRVRGVGREQGRRPRPRPLDEVRDSIIGKLEAIEGARRHEARERGEKVGSA